MGFNDEEREAYENHLKWLRIESNTLKKSEQKGREEGIEIGIEKGKIEGEQIGIEKGKRAERHTTVLKMLKLNSRP